MNEAHTKSNIENFEDSLIVMETLEKTQNLLGQLVQLQHLCFTYHNPKITLVWSNFLQNHLLFGLLKEESTVFSRQI